MKRIIKLSVVVLSLLIFNGCSAEKEPILDDSNGSNKRIVRKVSTEYSSVLERINKMIEVFNGKSINIQVDLIENKTATDKLPADITDIVKNSLNNIGDFVVVVYSGDSSREAQDSVILNGAITQYDVMSSKTQGVNAAGTGTVGQKHNRWDADGSMDGENKTVKLGIMFNPSDINTGNYIAKAATRNSIIIKTKSNAKEFAFSILGSGFGFSSSITKTQGIHESIIVLVELSLAEFLGKVGNLPYWLLLDGGKPNRHITKHLLKSFVKEPLRRKIQLISYLLYLHGEDVQISSSMTEDLKKAIRKYKSEHGLPVDDVLSKQFYMSLLKP